MKTKKGVTKHPLEACRLLVTHSAWFQADPMPGGLWMIEWKDESRPNMDSDLKQYVTMTDL